MPIVIISDRSDFVNTTKSAIKHLHGKHDITCLSLAEWERRDLNTVSPSTLLVADPQLCIITPGHLPGTFAFVRQIEAHLGEASTRWEPVSFASLLLWLHRDALSTSEEAGIRIQVRVDSQYIRERFITMPSRQSLIPLVRKMLQRSASRFNLLVNEYESKFCLAIGEALANAVFHGNLEMCSSLKEHDNSEFSRTVAIRESQEPYKSRTVTITETVSHDGIWITISDQGSGFNVRSAMESGRSPETLLCSGRGIIMMKGLSDDLFFSESGSEVTLVFFPPSQTTLPHTGFAQGELTQDESTTLIGS
jgi:Histidine kinase-like ATPase domain